MHDNPTIRRKAVDRDRIINEALALAEESGWNNLTVRALAKRINYKAPVLYQYFEGKEDLLRAIVNRGFSELHRRMQEAYDSNDGAKNKLIAMAVSRFNFAMENEALHALMFTTDAPCWQKQMVLEAMAEVKTQIQGLLQEVSGRHDQCKDLITNYICLIKGYNFFASELPADLVKREFFGEKTAEESLKNAMTRFIKSIQPDE